ncbi:MULTISPECIES: PepSY-associated TM helix domain-containing protein [unclassified Arcicella]|uniref:PepSY-associated TM helix domain-containing protein n=1 Tax=unclassified Arcicella TaxID=2644986 RepID=UPI0028577BAD|nr:MULTISPECIES: PepSY-associated TM helix domain-containing protein [unclassified Arcicella]MDR6564547.1 putative iron-regulated membrane protein [Arcicella sp. BE51]MDR6825743.1 putative iron-regulated membrane protein [Arcicella sp. BE139]
MKLKKIISNIHLWLGLTSGLVVFILGVTGCIYCFEQELQNCWNADKLYVSVSKQQRLPLDKLHAIAQAQLGNTFPISRIIAPVDKQGSYHFISSKYNVKGWNYFQQWEYNQTIYLNPYNGAVLGIENTKYSFFPIILRLHYDLLLGKVGKQIVGWSTVIFIILLVSGLVLWWPKNKAALKQRIRFDWKKTTQWKRKNYDLHNIPGFYSLLLALCIALSGLWFDFDWFKATVIWTANGGHIPAKEEPVTSDSLLTIQTSGILQKVASQSHRAVPDGKVFMFNLPEKENAKGVIRANIYHNANNYMKRSFLAFDQKSGELIRNKAYESQTSAEKFTSMIYDIHVGKALGLTGMILAFMASFIAATLPVTGFYIWWGRRKKRKQKPKNNNHSQEFSHKIMSKIQ